jgi:hypothetical protein
MRPNTRCTRRLRVARAPQPALLSAGVIRHRIVRHSQDVGAAESMAALCDGQTLTHDKRRSDDLAHTAGIPHHVAATQE